MRNLKVNHYYFESDKVSREYKIANLADWHNFLGMSPNLNNQIINDLSGINPDIIFLIGDYNDKLNDLMVPAYHQQSFDNLTQLCDIAPTFETFDWHNYLYVDEGQEIGKMEWFYDLWINVIEKSNLKNYHAFLPPDKNGIYPDQSGIAFNNELCIYGCSFDDQITHKNTYTYKDAYRAELKRFRDQLTIDPKMYNLLGMHVSSILFNKGKIAPVSELGLEGFAFVATGHTHKSMMFKIPDKLPQLVRDHAHGLISPEKRPLPYYMGGPYLGEELDVGVALAIMPVPSTAPQITQLANLIYPPYLDIYHIVPKQKALQL